MSDMKRLTKLATELAGAELKKLEYERLAEEQAKIVKDLAESQIPTLMEELGQSAFRTTHGLEIELVDVVHASFPKDEERQKEAITYLREHGDEGLVKYQFTIRFERHQQDLVEAFRRLLKSSAVATVAAIEEGHTVHHSTLTAYVKEQLKLGHNIPLKIFGAIATTRAKLRGL